MTSPMYFLPRDLHRLEELIAQVEQTYKKNLGSIGETADISSETWHDNPAFDEAQQLAKSAYGQFKKLTSIRNQAKLVTEPPSGDVVAIGCRVRYSRSDFRGDDEVVVASDYLVESADDEISTGSPIGQLLLGAKVGEQRKGKIADRIVTLEVREIRIATEYFE